jgi:hypothetical protein
VSDTEGITKVFDREVSLCLRPVEELHRLGERHETGRREVVDLQPLAQELGVALRLLMLEQTVCERLERH